jgi:nucleoside-diphosphate-sugar epimerase
VKPTCSTAFYYFVYRVFIVKALVTGANGFLGSHLVRQLLDRGYKVTAMTRRRNEMFSSLDVQTVHGDIRSFDNVFEACKNQDVVFHTAAVSGIWGPWKHFHGTNTIGTRNVVEACLQHDTRKLVYTSSPSVTFDGDHQININETAPYSKKWLCHYPHSKALAEKYVLDADDDKELMTCALRPHLIWGPGDHHLIPRLIKRAKAKQLRRVGDGTNQVDTIYVENAALAHIQAAEAMEPGSPVCGSAYFLSQDEPVNCWDWINDILALAGLPRIRQSISYYWAYRLGYSLETIHQMFNMESEPRMTRFLAAQLAKSHFFDISRAKHDFGYFPQVTMAQGMERLGESLRKTEGVA